MIRATEELKNSTLGIFFVEMVFFNNHLGGDFGRLREFIKKLFNGVLSAHRLRVYAKFGVFGVRETLSGHDRQTDIWMDGRTDMAKSIFLIALI